MPGNCRIRASLARKIAHDEEKNVGNPNIDTSAPRGHPGGPKIDLKSHNGFSLFFHSSRGPLEEQQQGRRPAQNHF